MSGRRQSRRGNGNAWTELVERPMHGKFIEYGNIVEGNRMRAYRVDPRRWGKERNAIIVTHTANKEEESMFFFSGSWYNTSLLYCWTGLSMAANILHQVPGFTLSRGALLSSKIRISSFFFVCISCEFKRANLEDCPNPKEELAAQVMSALAQIHGSSYCITTVGRFESLRGGFEEADMVMDYFTNYRGPQYLLIDKDERIEDVKNTFGGRSLANVPQLNWNTLHLHWTLDRLQKEKRGLRLSKGRWKITRM